MAQHRSAEHRSGEHRYADRQQAGRELEAALADEHLHEPVVLALPRGGVPVAAEVATGLDAVLDVFVARKVGAPGQPELGIGAIAEGSDRIVLNEAASSFRLGEADLERMVQAERTELARRVEHYRGGRRLPDLQGRDVVLVDDGLATGVTAEAALLALAERAPRRLLLAVPVCAPDAARRLGELAEVRCLQRPSAFRAVGLWYEDFGQTSDDEVLDLLDRVAAGA